MEILSDPTPDMLAMPRFDDGAIDMQELLRRLAEQVVNAVMDAEADQLCGGGANGRNSCRKHADAAHPEAPHRHEHPQGAEGDREDGSLQALQVPGERHRVVPGADVEELGARPLDGTTVLYLWLEATYVKCRRGGCVASTAVVTAIGCDTGGWRRVPGVDVVNTESYDSWLTFLRKIRDRGVDGVGLVVSDAHPGLVRALG